MEILIPGVFHPEAYSEAFEQNSYSLVEVDEKRSPVKCFPVIVMF
jgi:hypothetical protein